MAFLREFALAEWFGKAGIFYIEWSGIDEEADD